MSVTTRTETMLRRLHAALRADAAAAPGAQVAASAAEVAALHGRAAELEAAALEVRRALRRVRGAQSCLRLLLPRELAPDAFGELAINAGNAVREAPTAAGRAFFGDLNTFIELDGMRIQLGRLLAQTRRYAAVTDLMVVASQLLEPSTRAMAEELVDAHLGACRRRLVEAAEACADFPRLGTALAARLGAAAS